MAEKPIQFSTPMVQAILDGRKHMTRRVAHFPEGTHTVEFEDGKFLAMWGRFDEVKNVFADGETEVSPRYRVGDILWVRETWCRLWDLDINDQIIEGTGHFYYAADGINPTPYNHFPDEDGFNGDRAGPRWSPSMFMPRAAARIFLRVTDVRVERLRAITDEDAIAEGANWLNGKNVGFEEKMRRTAVERFRELWDSINGKKDGGRYAWDRNPWVWVYTFERVSMEVRHESRADGR